jgi:hypothetical protein
MSELTFDENLHRYLIDDVPAVSVTQALVDAGLVDTRWFTDFARDRGSAVHKAIQLHEEDDLDESSIGDDVRPYFEAYLKFKAEYSWCPVGTEIQVWDKAHGFAGTIDQLGEAHGALAIVDFKTGQLSPAVGIQLTGYQILLQLQRSEKVQKLLAVRLVGDGSYKIQTYKSDPGVFFAALKIAQWKRSI